MTAHPREYTRDDGGNYKELNQSNLECIAPTPTSVFPGSRHEDNYRHSRDKIEK